MTRLPLIDPDAATGSVKDSEIHLARNGTSSDPKIAALVTLGLQIAVSPGSVTDEDVAGIHPAVQAEAA